MRPAASPSYGGWPPLSFLSSPLSFLSFLGAILLFFLILVLSSMVSLISFDGGVDSRRISSRPGPAWTRKRAGPLRGLGLLWWEGWSLVGRSFSHCLSRLRMSDYFALHVPATPLTLRVLLCPAVSLTDTGSDLQVRWRFLVWLLSFLAIGTELLLNQRWFRQDGPLFGQKAMNALSSAAASFRPLETTARVLDRQASRSGPIVGLRRTVVLCCRWNYLSPALMLVPVRVCFMGRVPFCFEPIMALWWFRFSYVVGLDALFPPLYDPLLC
ncbi:hypothetical protein GQ457_16G002540 [Hibiscus cannabinus]